MKYESNGKDRIYFTFTTAHPDNNNPNWVYYAEIDINTLNLYNIENTLLCKGENLPYGKEKSIDTSSDYGSLTVDSPSDKRDWVWDVCKDDAGNPVILFTRISANKAQHDYYYARWNSSEKKWDKTYIANGGGWFHQNANGAEKCYSGGMCLDHSDPSVVYVSKPTEGFYGSVYEIWKLKMDGANVVSETQITKNSEFNNVRPFVARGGNGDELISLTWMNGIYYYWIGDEQFPTKIMTDAEVPEFNFNYGLEKITLPEIVSTDLILPELTYDGLEIEWKSSNENVIDEKGFVAFSDKDEKVTLTAETKYGKKEFEITVSARDVEKNNMVLHYEFEFGDVYEKDNVRYVKDKSENGNDAVVFQDAKVNGVLDLRSNTGDVKKDGYALAPDGVFDNLRSYTFALRVNADNLNGQPRFYDFGSDAGNSVFLRGDKLSAGVKYNNGTTVMLSPDSALKTDTEYFLTVTYDAKTNTTKMYIDGKAVAVSNNLKVEPYKVSGKRNYIGRTQWWDTTVANANLDFCGTIDDFMLFDTALSSEETQKLYVKNNAKITVELDEKNNLTVTLKNVSEEAVTVVACFDESDNLTAAIIMETESVRVPNADKYKVFCFESKTSIKPLCEAVTVKRGEE